jgi:hypothetical protein
MGPASLQLSTAIVAATTLAAQDATALALHIESTRQGSKRVAYALNILCAVASTFAAVAVAVRSERGKGSVFSFRLPTSGTLGVV